ncbi:MAG TPA: N-6 DNA methylase [Verrucomicrobiae bacterium]|nr:N-6 DNA methylase [Verrucomicrobiae bacterium]
MSTKSRECDFRDILKHLSHSRDIRRVFDAFVRLSACALAAQTREPEYLEEAGRWERAELELFGNALGALIAEMEQHPFEDLIGGFYMECAISSKGQKWNGEFHTPKPVCDLMAQITVGNLDSVKSDSPINVCEPACGAGAMILSFAEACPPEVRRRLRFTAIDINRTACDMAFINTTLWGIPTRVIHGNSLSPECWAAWSNIHWIMPWLSLLPMHPIAAMCPLEPRKDIGQGEPPKVEEMEQIRTALHKQELQFG